MTARLPGDNSPVAGLTDEHYHGHTMTVENVLSVATAPLTRLPPNPNRVAWQIINEGANDVRVSFLPDITASSGWLLASNGGSIGMEWDEDGEGVTYDIYLIASVAACNVRVREVIRT